MGASSPARADGLLTAVGWLWVALMVFLGLIALSAGSSKSMLFAGLSALTSLPPLWNYGRKSGWRDLIIARLLIGIAAFIAWGVYLNAAGRPAGKQPQLVAEVAPPVAFDQIAARRLCEPEIRRRLSHPSTASFSWFAGATFRSDGRKSAYATKLTAKNSFGLEIAMVGACTFDSGDITDVSVEEE